MKAGPHKVGVTFVARSFAETDDTLEPLGRWRCRASPGVFGVEIVGPVKPTRHHATRRAASKIFVCRPANEAEELPCAKQIVSTLARKAFRRPVTDADLAAPMRFYERGPAEGRLRGRHPAGRDGHPREPEVPVSRRSAAAGRAARQDLSRSATSSSPRASRSSCGARGRTMSCSTAATAGKLRDPASARAAGAAHARGSALEVAHDELRGPVADRGRDRRASSPIRRCSPSSTTRCARASARRSSCSSTACSRKTRTWWTCSPRTTRS